MFNFAGRRMSGFEVIEAGLRSPPSPGQEGKKKKRKRKKKGPVSIALRPRLKTQTDSISAKVFVQLYFIYGNLEEFF